MPTIDKLSAQEDLIHSSNSSRKADQFKVSFFGIPENVANILGKELRSIDRLNFQIDSTKMRRNGGLVLSHKDQTTYDPINLIFHEDENGIVEGFILSQIFRQNNMTTDLLDREDHRDRIYKFDVRVECFNQAGKLTSGTVFKNCFFTSLAMQTMAYDDDGECIINCLVDFDDVELYVVDTWITIT